MVVFPSRRQRVVSPTRGMTTPQAGWPGVRGPAPAPQRLSFTHKYCYARGSKGLFPFLVGEGWDRGCGPRCGFIVTPFDRPPLMMWAYTLATRSQRSFTQGSVRTHLGAGIWRKCPRRQSFAASSGVRPRSHAPSLMSAKPPEPAAVAAPGAGQRRAAHGLPTPAPPSGASSVCIRWNRRRYTSSCLLSEWGLHLSPHGTLRAVLQSTPDGDIPLC